ncbi:MAG: hypothetical protein GY786_15360 [Proteobacteria bacterium]|nr:hypothetical protein [Pseudomonadota bacterium]
MVPGSDKLKIGGINRKSEMTPGESGGDGRDQEALWIDNRKGLSFYSEKVEREEFSLEMKSERATQINYNRSLKLTLIGVKMSLFWI